MTNRERNIRNALSAFACKNKIALIAVVEDLLDSEGPKVLMHDCDDRNELEMLTGAAEVLVRHVEGCRDIERALDKLLVPHAKA